MLGGAEKTLADIAAARDALGGDALTGKLARPSAPWSAPASGPCPPAPVRAAPPSS